MIVAFRLYEAIPDRARAAQSGAEFASFWFEPGLYLYWGKDFESRGEKTAPSQQAKLADRYAIEVPLREVMAY